jgi:hypothetical protein
MLHAGFDRVISKPEPKRTLVVTRTPPLRARPNTSFVATPLDLIAMLEEERDMISTVVLTGNFASMRELTMFLVDSYPALRILSGDPGEEPDIYLPAYS